VQTLLFVLGSVAAAIGAIGLFAIVISSRRAPLGFEDRRGFHFVGQPKSDTTVDLPANTGFVPHL
jgi:hypothetical protein